MVIVIVYDFVIFVVTIIDMVVFVLTKVVNVVRYLVIMVLLVILLVFSIYAGVVVEIFVKELVDTMDEVVFLVLVFVQNDFDEMVNSEHITFLVVVLVD